MNFRIFVLLTLTIILSGCSTIGNLANPERLDRIAVGLDVVQLDKEYEATLEALMSLNWNEAELNQVRMSIAELQRLKNNLDDLVDGNSDGLSLVLEAADTRNFLDHIATHYNSIQMLYSNYLTRTGEPVNKQLLDYGRAGHNVWNYMYSQAVSGNGATVETVKSLLSYVVRGYLLHTQGSI